MLYACVALDRRVCQVNYSVSVCGHLVSAGGAAVRPDGGQDGADHGTVDLGQKPGANKHITCAAFAERNNAFQIHLALPWQTGS